MTIDFPFTVPYVPGNTVKLSLSPTQPPSIFDKFHTGAAYGVIDPTNLWDYPYWGSARQNLTYSYIQGASIINPDGTTTHTQWEDDLTDAYIQRMYDNGAKYPIVEMYITNLDTDGTHDGVPFSRVTKSDLTNFLRRVTKFNSLQGGHQLIWNPCGEFNYPSRAYAAWGDRGDDAHHTWNADPTYYNQVMPWIRQILDSENIKNVLLGVHINQGFWSYLPNGITDYVPGMRYADVVGASMYCQSYGDTLAEVTRAWDDAYAIWQLIGTNKPWFFIEYGDMSDATARNPYTGNLDPWYTKITSSYVNLSYGLLATHSFVKCIDWYFPGFNQDPTVFQTIADNIQLHG
jgi:hypothetical protein